MDERSEPALEPITPRRVLEHINASSPVSRAMSIEIVDGSEGRCVIAMTIRADMANAGGVAHGGMIFALADNAIAFACCTRNTRVLTMSATIEYLASSHIGERVVAEAVETYREGRNAIYDARVWVDGGATVAHLRGRVRIVDEPII